MCTLSLCKRRGISLSHFHIRNNHHVTSKILEPNNKRYVAKTCSKKQTTCRQVKVSSKIRSCNKWGPDQETQGYYKDPVLMLLDKRTEGYRIERRRKGKRRAMHQKQISKMNSRQGSPQNQHLKPSDLLEPTSSLPAGTSTAIVQS